MKCKVLIMGAAGRDFHNFNLYFRDNPNFKVVAFTSSQIPGIDEKKYPAELIGKELYPDGIPIFPEDELVNIIKQENIEQVYFSYSDISHQTVMNKACIVNACGADFILLGGNKTIIKTEKPVISVCASRTGCGKSQTTRKILELLIDRGLKAVAIRHPMPYGNLVKQKVQRFAKLEDLKKHNCTIEEMEEFEPHIVRGNVVYAGVDYQAIINEAEKEADVIVWDGGNNDTSFYRSNTKNLTIVVVDPLRVGNEMSFFPGETNVRMADVIIINKIDTASFENISQLRENINFLNPTAQIIEAASPISIDKPGLLNIDTKVLCIEDGPTLTHGHMKIGAATVAAKKLGVKEFIDPRPWTVGEVAKTFKDYPDIGKLLPAMGYGTQQIKDLETTINQAECDVVVVGTPIDLRRLISINKPTVRVEYNLQEIGDLNLKKILHDFS